MPTAQLILLVDDIPDHAVMYGRALVQHGFRVHLARSGKEALSLVRKAMPTCAVIDLRLPDMSGWDLCRELKQHKTTIGMPVVVLTPDLSKMCAADSAKAGCNAWLSHPTVADDLVRTVKHVLDLDTAEPESAEGAILNLKECPACDSDQVRPRLRIGPIQHYCCTSCGVCWRVEVVVEPVLTGP